MPDRTRPVDGRLSVRLSVRPVAECSIDQLSLGEVMERLDPGELRVRTMSSVAVWVRGR